MIEYIENFISSEISLIDKLDWINHLDSPRLEYYCNDYPLSYTYGRGRGIRTYQPQPWVSELLKIRAQVEKKLNDKFEMCFCNLYETEQNALGWHSDDSPIIRQTSPIAVISFGAEREIWFQNVEKINSIKKILLQNGSLCVMPAGFQQTHLHRIPKHSAQCGPRVSVTFRGLNLNE